MKLKKEDVDKVIAICRKYYSTGDTDYLPRYRELFERVFGENQHWIKDIFTGIVCKAFDYSEPNETYYKVLKVFGFKIE